MGLARFPALRPEVACGWAMTAKRALWCFGGSGRVNPDYRP